MVSRHAGGDPDIGLRRSLPDADLLARRAVVEVAVFRIRVVAAQARGMPCARRA
jgi:hypothetical protein